MTLVEMNTALLHPCRILDNSPEGVQHTFCFWSFDAFFTHGIERGRPGDILYYKYEMGADLQQLLQNP